MDVTPDCLLVSGVVDTLTRRRGRGRERRGKEAERLVEEEKEVRCEKLE